MNNSMKSISTASVALLTIALLTGCSATPSSNLSPVGPLAPTSSAPDAPVNVDGSYASILAASIADVEQSGFTEEQKAGQESGYTFVYDPSLPLSKNAALVVSSDVAIPMPANNLGQQDGEGKGALHVLFREQREGATSKASKTGFTVTSPSGTIYTVTVTDDRITAIAMDDPAAGSSTSAITYSVSKAHRALIEAAYQNANAG